MWQHLSYHLVLKNNPNYGKVHPNTSQVATSKLVYWINSRLNSKIFWSQNPQSRTVTDFIWDQKRKSKPAAGKQAEAWCTFLNRWLNSATKYSGPHKKNMIMWSEGKKVKEIYCLFMDVSRRTRTTSRKNCSVMGVHYLVKQHSFLDGSRKTLTVKMFDRGVIAFLVCGAAGTLFNQVETVRRISRYSRGFSIQNVSRPKT